jgi:signal peptidase II
MPRAWPWLAAAAAIALADRLTKLMVLAAMQPGELREVTGFFNLVLVFNKGAAFSFLAEQPGWQTPFFIAVSVIASVVLVVLLVREPARRLLCAGFAAILGGALGNLWDRIAYGKVVDFLDFHAFGWHWPAFNVADSAISIGAALVILDSFLDREKPSAPGQA